MDSASAAAYIVFDLVGFQNSVHAADQRLSTVAGGRA